MTQADRVLSTPPTNTPIDRNRRRFLAVVAGSTVASIAPVITARAADSLGASQRLDAASDVLADALVRLIYAQEVYARAEANSEKWEAAHRVPASKRGQRRRLKRLNAFRETFIPAAWQALMQAEADFTEAQTVLAATPIAGMDDFKTMIVSAELYDDVDLCRINRAPISRAVVAHVAEMARGGQS
jgi:hypothetical protein